MEFRPDGSVLVQTALSMSRLSHEELSLEAAEIAKLVRRRSQSAQSSSGKDLRALNVLRV
jgi:hypothetical protein